MAFRCFTTNFETEYRKHLVSIKRHLSSLEQETTLAHRLEIHSWLAQGGDVDLSATGQSPQYSVWLVKPVQLKCADQRTETRTVAVASRLQWSLKRDRYGANP